MEHLPRTRGEPSEISSHDEPAVYDRRAAEALPPTTFAEAEQHNAFTLLTELHDHALTFTAEGGRPPRAVHHLAELALSAAVVAWWSRWQPISMHRALLAGASLANVAAAAGTSEAEVIERWAAWAEGQSKLRIGDRPGVAPSEIAAIRARFPSHTPG